ncbi:MAG: exodeoxyribonuclease VII large subunit [Candidatus Aenigmatarchaeota archaeon]
MESKKLLKASIVIAIIGIVSLFFLTRSSIETVKISDVKIGQLQRISGMVTSVYVSKDGHVFLKVADNTGEIQVVVFKNSNIEEAYELENGDEITVLGRVSEYKDQIEIIAKRIDL